MDKLMQYVADEGIFLSFQDFSGAPRSLFGLYFYDHVHQVPHVILERSLQENSPLYRCVLAEELGHHFTIPQGDFLAPYTSYSNKLKLSRDEARALRWAADALMPEPEFWAAVASGARTVDELAERFNVTRWMVYHRLHLVSAVYGDTGLPADVEHAGTSFLPCISPND